ncbi:cupin [Candidatus Wolfebacteria bacterium CG10_big_fil_rev_8_21_14_0_10_31_9]|uniref:Cupin n=1 Tax=Candidatus Wolfebacteria bacterium CG10_big_fil_rev_8_21_14_0_10_31_9 TaxID=1975070 RepID=A0A2H0RCL6_9BACT|nr:MAG: cupin [Candidatus Wolfebacteria bacterium CG10_big_fil_rev_8_21_14_0_10_31_9]
MNLEEYKQRATLIRDNEIYKVYDLPELKDLSISLTELHPLKSTTGHSHDNADEIYIFIDGEGIIEIGNQTSTVKGGDIILVPRGDFHKVHNKKETSMHFWSLFEKYEGRGK